MNDRELLELAARAAGLEIVKHCQDARDKAGYGHVGLYVRESGSRFASTGWNPLTHDSDALRLAVNLNLLVLPYPGDEAVRVTRLDQPDTIVAWGTPPDPYAATRRAIVRAAAEIGAAQ